MIVDLQMVLEQVHRPFERRCPFAKASIEVTDLLSDYWNVTANGRQLFPLHFLVDHGSSLTLSYSNVFWTQ
jgi:engulfment/cell motility protein 1